MVEKTNDKTRAIKWFVTIVAAVMFIVTTLLRSLSGQGADNTVAWVFLVIAGLPWGANFIDWFKAKK